MTTLSGGNLDLVIGFVEIEQASLGVPTAQPVHVVDDLAGGLSPVEANDLLVGIHLRQHADMAAGAAAEFVDALAIGKIGAEQVLLVDAAPVRLELRLEYRLGKPRNSRTGMFGRTYFGVSASRSPLLATNSSRFSPQPLTQRVLSPGIEIENSLRRIRSSSPVTRSSSASPSIQS